MKYYNKKIENFIEWMKHSGEEGDDPIYRIPTIQLFEQFRMESDSPVEELTDEERKYLELYTENLVFQLSLKGVIKSDVSKLFLESNFGWVPKNKADDNEVVDYVSFDSSGLLTENTTNHDNEDLTNDAVTQLLGKGKV